MNILTKITYSNDTINGENFVTDVDMYIGGYNSLAYKIYEEVKNKTDILGELIFPDVYSVFKVLKEKGYIDHTMSNCWYRYKIN